MSAHVVLLGGWLCHLCHCCTSLFPVLFLRAFCDIMLCDMFSDLFGYIVVLMFGVLWLGLIWYDSFDLMLGLFTVGLFSVLCLFEVMSSRLGFGCGWLWVVSHRYRVRYHWCDLWQGYTTVVFTRRLCLVTQLLDQLLSYCLVRCHFVSIIRLRYQFITVYMVCHFGSIVCQGC